MSNDRDVDRIVRSWMGEGVTQLPDRVLDLVLDQIPATPQRPAGWLARRFPIMNNTALRIGVAAVAVVLLAIVGLNLLGRSNVGGPTPTSTPTPTATPSPSVAATPAALPAGEIPPGRYHVSQESISFSVAISSTLWQGTNFPPNIETRESFPNPGYAWITFLSRLDAVSIDPCAGTVTPVTSVDDAATALTQIAGTDAVAPTDVTIGGVPAKLVVLTINGDFACDQTSFWLYGDTSFYPNDKDSVIRDWVLDLDGQTYLLHTDQIGTDAVLGSDIEQLIDSIQFE